MSNLINNKTALRTLLASVQEKASQGSPVSSVNGKTGDVTLGIADFGLASTTWSIPLEDDTTLTKNVVALPASNPIDFANLKSLSIPEGIVKRILCGDVVLWKSGYVNQVPISTETAGGTAIYNSGKGYKEGVRLSSSGAEKSQSGAVVTGFIPAKRGDIIRMKGATWGTTVSEGYCYIVAYGTNGGKLYHANKYMNNTTNNNISNQVGVDLSNSSIITDSNGVTTFNIVWTGSTEIAYIRISATGNGADMIVTINEEIE